MSKANSKSEESKNRRNARKEARKKLKDGGRTSESKKALERVLIVSEGIKTEPIYFEKLVDHLKLITADIKVTGAAHSCPKKVVEHAITLYEESLGTKNEYDLVFCVIDKDSHPHYTNAIHKAEAYSPKDIIHIINSIPCFELWLLLHYEYTVKPFSKSVKNSICASLIKNDLKKYLPSYVKNISNLNESELSYIFNNSNIKLAKERAEKLSKYCLANTIDNPSTRIHDLVALLQEIKTRPHD